MKFINTTTNHTQHETLEEIQAETDIQGSKKLLPSYTEAIKKFKQKRK